jgi:hypothetical protein
MGTPCCARATHALPQVEEQAGSSNPRFGGPLRVYFVSGEALERFSQVQGGEKGVVAGGQLCLTTNLEELRCR